MITKLRVEGMSCQHCVRRVKTYLESLPDVSDVQVDLEGKEAVFHSDGNLDMQGILTAIGEFGFTAKEQA